VRWVREALGVLFLLVGGVIFVLGLVGAFSGIGGDAIVWFFVVAIALGAVGGVLASIKPRAKATPRRSRP
jgi:hypothetical protein